MLSFEFQMNQSLRLHSGVLALSKLQFLAEVPLYFVDILVESDPIINLT